MSRVSLPAFIIRSETESIAASLCARLVRRSFEQFLMPAIVPKWAEEAHGPGWNRRKRLCEAIEVLVYVDGWWYPAQLTVTVVLFIFDYRESPINHINMNIELTSIPEDAPIRIPSTGRLVQPAPIINFVERDADRSLGIYFSTTVESPEDDDAEALADRVRLIVQAADRILASQNYSIRCPAAL